MAVDVPEDRLFTATEVKAALAAVILYERARAERDLQILRASVDSAIRSTVRLAP